MLQNATGVAQKEERGERANGQEFSHNKPSVVVCVCVCVKMSCQRKPWPVQSAGEITVMSFYRCEETKCQEEKFGK